MAATWTGNPTTWQAGDLLTAAEFNAEFRDRFDWLKARLYNLWYSAAGFSTTSTSFVDVDAGCSVNLVPTGTVALIMFSGGLNHSVADGETVLDLLQNGVSLGNTDGIMSHTASTASAMSGCSFFKVVTGLTAGVSYTFKLQWKVNGAGTARMGGTATGNPQRIAASLLAIDFQ